MNIGDRVRLLKGKEEGVIIGFKGNTVQVEIEDGFAIPVMRAEIVIISTDENRLKDAKTDMKPQNNEAPKVEVLSQKGIFMAFLPLNDQLFALYLINNTDYQLPFSVAAQEKNLLKQLQAGFLKSREAIKIEETTLATFEQWATYILQFLYSKTGYFEPKQPFIKKIKFRANTFFKAKQNAPVLNKEAYLFQIDQDATLQNLDADAIKEAILEKNSLTTQTDYKAVLEGTSEEIDLHIEKLTTNFIQMRPEEMFALQVETFQKHLENAVAKGISKITFIHGIGNGKLKSEIHKKISGHAHVEYFQDAQKDKFGYGATLIKLK